MSETEFVTVTVGEKQYAVIKTGRAQARQVLQLTRWIGKHGSKAFGAFRNDDEFKIDNATGLDFIQRFAEALDEDALIDLFQLLVGCSMEEAETYFDVATLIEVVIAVYNGQPAVGRLIDRFFSPSNSNNSTDAPSTTSESPTDGPTTKS